MVCNSKYGTYHTKIISLPKASSRSSTPTNIYMRPADLSGLTGRMKRAHVPRAETQWHFPGLHPSKRLSFIGRSGLALSGATLQCGWAQVSPSFSTKWNQSSANQSVAFSPTRHLTFVSLPPLAEPSPAHNTPRATHLHLDNHSSSSSSYLTTTLSSTKR